MAISAGIVNHNSPFKRKNKNPQKPSFLIQVFKLIGPARAAPKLVALFHPSFFSFSSALPQKSWVMSGSALPPDVRRWLCPADSSQIIPGLCPLVRAWPFGLIGPKAAPRAQPKNVKGIPKAGRSHRLTSGAKPKPHHQRTFRQSSFPPYWILPQALVFQLSMAFSPRIHGGNGINSNSESALT
jgi:hypothetical protein